MSKQRFFIDCDLGPQIIIAASADSARAHCIDEWGEDYTPRVVREATSEDEALVKSYGVVYEAP